MTTLVVLVCLLAGYSICARAGDPAGEPGLRVDATGEWTKPDVLHPHKKYFVQEGSLFDIQCSLTVDAKKDCGVSWSKVDTDNWSTTKVNQKSDKTARLVFSRVSASNAGRYDCVADHTYANLSVELFVSSDSVSRSSYGPLDESANLTLECKAENPRWTLNGLAINDKKVTAEGKTLVIKSPVGARTGVYMCSATGERVSQVQMFRVLGVPVMGKGHNQGSKNMMEGEHAELKCDVIGYPAPSVTWMKNDTEKGELTDVSTIDKAKFSEHNGIEGAMVSVPNLEFTDSADYVCFAENEHGRTSFSTTLRVKDKLAALWPFLGIVVEVIVLVSIIFIYEKRRSSKEQPPVDEDDEEEEQKKALTSGETIDVRQRGMKS